MYSSNWFVEDCTIDGRIGVDFAETCVRDYIFFVAEN